MMKNAKRLIAGTLAAVTIMTLIEFSDMTVYAAEDIEIEETVEVETEEVVETTVIADETEEVETTKVAVRLLTINWQEHKTLSLSVYYVSDSSIGQGLKGYFSYSANFA